jgi:cell division protein FtsZ
MKLKIRIIGAGTAGCNIVNYIIDNMEVDGIDLVAVDSNATVLMDNRAPHKLFTGEPPELFSADGKSLIDMEAKKKFMEHIREHLAGIDMVLVIAGMGGATGTEIASVIAETAKKMGILVIGIAAMPFTYEPETRRQYAREGLMRMAANVDTLLRVDNDRCLILDSTRIYEGISRAFLSIVKGITDLFLHPGIVSVDFADIKGMMSNAGFASVGVGFASVDCGLADMVVKNALRCPLMDPPELISTKNVLLNITTGHEAANLTMLTEIANGVAGELIKATTGVNNIMIWGHCIDKSLEAAIQITVFAIDCNSCVPQHCH